MEQSDLDLLSTIPPYHLQSLLRTRHVPAPFQERGSRENEGLAEPQLREIAQALFDRAAITSLFQQAGEIERLVLGELAACGGRANSRDLALYFSASGLLDAATSDDLAEPGHGQEYGRLQEALQYPTPHPHGVFEQALRNLLLQGLLFWGRQTHFAGRDYASGVYDGVLIMPQAVREVISELVEQEHGATPEDEQPEEIGEGARALQRRLYLYWSFVASRRDGLALLNSGLLSRPALRQVVEALGGGALQSEQARAENDLPHLLFIRLLLQHLGLLQQRQGVVYAAPAETFFTLPLLERARRCYRAWLETGFWNEIAYLPEVIVRPGPAPLDTAHEEVIRARHTVVERLLREPADRPRALAAFIARTKFYAPYLLFPRQYGPRAERYSLGSNPYDWDFRLRRGWLTHREGWYLVEGGFIRAVVTGPLQWLGLVMLEGEGTRAVFRLAPGYRAIMGLTSPQPEELEPAWGRLIVQPNFEIVALAPVSEGLMVRLDRFAERSGLEHIAQYRLSRASVTRAIQTGQRAEDIQRMLEQASGSPLPQNVGYSLAEWERQARRVELWRDAVLLEVDDAVLLDALCDDEALRPLLARRLTPTLMQVAPRHLPTVQEALWRLGYLPALSTTAQQSALLENGQAGACEPQWRLHPDGRLEPLYAVTDLYLAAELERISEPGEEGAWRRLTPDSLQRARESGLSLEQVLRFLQNYCEGGIPTSLLISLKLWGDGYGEQHAVRIEPAPMLSLSAEALRDLQADEELAALLGAEVEQQRRLVRVEAEHLERVIKLLRARGFDIE